METGVTLSEKRCFISSLQQEHSVREICEILGVNRSSFYYHPQEDPSEALLRSEIEKLAGQYPRYGYRRITQLLQRQGYTVGTRRVARLMKIVISWLLSSVRVKQQDRFRGINLGATVSKPLKSLVRIRSGWLILHTCVSRDVSSM